MISCAFQGSIYPCKNNTIMENYLFQIEYFSNADYSCDCVAKFSTVITSVFSVTQSFINYFNMLIWYLSMRIVMSQTVDYARLELNNNNAVKTDAKTSILTVINYCSCLCVHWTVHLRKNNGRCGLCWDRVCERERKKGRGWGSH